SGSASPGASSGTNCQPSLPRTVCSSECWIQTTGTCSRRAFSTRLPTFATTTSRACVPARTSFCTSTTTSTVFGRFSSVVMSSPPRRARVPQRYAASAVPPRRTLQLMGTRLREYDLERPHEPGAIEAVVLQPARPSPAVAAAQQQFGNRALGRMLARDPNPALRNAPPPPLKKPGEVDAIFDASVHLKDMIGAKLGKGSLKKAMHLDDAGAFEAAWVEYAMRSINPDTKQAFASKDEALAFLKKKGVRAFQDETRGAIHIN